MAKKVRDMNTFSSLHLRGWRGELDSGWSCQLVTWHTHYCSILITNPPFKKAVMLYKVQLLQIHSWSDYANSIVACANRSTLGMLTKVLATSTLIMTLWCFTHKRHESWRLLYLTKSVREGGDLKSKVNPWDLPLNWEIWSLCNWGQTYRIGQ